MAFVYRSDRENSPQKSNPNLGPGAYIGISKRFLLLYEITII